MRKPTFWFLTWSGTNQAVQLQKMARSSKFYVAKTKALISFVVTAKLICVFVFTYAKRWFSHETAHLSGVDLTAWFGSELVDYQKTCFVDTWLNRSFLVTSGSSQPSGISLCYVRSCSTGFIQVILP